MMTPKTQQEASEKALRMKQDAPPTSVPYNDGSNLNDYVPQTQKQASERAYALKRGPPRVLISDKDVATIIGGSRATVWRRVGDGTLPKPIKFGGMTRWVLTEVEAAICRAMAARDAEGV